MAFRYQLLATLGRGGMADIYLAVARRSLGFSKLVVLKHLRSYEDDQRTRDMFLDEARLAARLSHPNIVDTYDVGLDGDAHFIAMEYLEGQSLSRILRAVHHGQVSATVWARIVADALRGLHYAHELCDYDGMPLEIVHRDISPPNIFVTYGGEIKIVDFGIAKATLNSFHTEPGVFKGKLGYMAPEQVNGGVVDRRADIFAMGIVLWEALVGRRLLEGGIRHFLETEGSSPLPTVISVKPEVDPRLSRIVERALAIDPRDRYATAAEMGEAVEAFLFDAPHPMSRVDIGQVVLSLFADHRASVHRQIEKHLAAADRAVVEGDFWASSGIVIAGDGHASPAFPRSVDDETQNEVPLFSSGAGPSTQPHALSDSWAPPPTRSSPVRWLGLMLGGGLVAAALGIPFLLQRTPAPHQPMASLAPSSAAAALETAPSQGSGPELQALPPKTEPELATKATAHAPVRRAATRNKRSRAATTEAVSETQESAPAPPLPVAQPEAPPPAPVATSQPASPAAPPPSSPSPVRGKQASSTAIAPAAEPGPPPGTVDAKEVAATVRAHSGEVRQCWDRARMDHPDLHGRLTVQARINPAGKVLSTSVANAIEDGARLSSCVVSAFQSWTFPAPTGGVNGNASYSFVFE